MLMVNKYMYVCMYIYILVIVTIVTIVTIVNMVYELCASSPWFNP